jgi:hypothetical protein
LANRELAALSCLNLAAQPFGLAGLVPNRTQNCRTIVMVCVREEALTTKAIGELREKKYPKLLK